MSGRAGGRGRTWRASITKKFRGAGQPPCITPTLCWQERGQHVMGGGSGGGAAGCSYTTQSNPSPRLQLIPFMKMDALYSASLLTPACSMGRVRSAPCGSAPDRDKYLSGRENWRAPNLARSWCGVCGEGGRGREMCGISRGCYLNQAESMYHVLV